MTVNIRTRLEGLIHIMRETAATLDSLAQSGMSDEDLSQLVHRAIGSMSDEIETIEIEAVS